MLEPLLAKYNEQSLKISKSSFKNILILSLSMLIGQTVCLNKLKGLVGQLTGKLSTKSSSNYQRLIRIFHHHAFSRLWLDLLIFVFELLRLKSEYLTLDGTSWKQGKRWHHYLTLCIVYQGVAIPIYWVDLEKHGISSTKERKKLLKRVLKSFNLRNKILLADREYIGTDWFKYLIDSGLNFVIRSKKRIYKGAIDQAQGKSLAALVAKVKGSKIPNKSVRKAFFLNGMKLFIVVIKNPNKRAKEAIIFLITNIDQAASCTAAMYRIRWTIEHCFKQLKSNGFNLESMNLKGPARRNLLMAIVIFTYVLSILEGLKDYKKVPLKKYKDGTITKTVSVFRHGIDKLVIICQSLEIFIKYIFQAFKYNKTKYHSANLLNV